MFNFLKQQTTLLEANPTKFTIFAPHLMFIRRMSTQSQIENIRFTAQSYRNDVRYQIEMLEVLVASEKYEETIEYYNSLSENMKLHSKCRNLYSTAVHKLNLRENENATSTQIAPLTFDFSRLGKISLRNHVSKWNSFFSVIVSLIALAIFSLFYLTSNPSKASNIPSLQNTHKKADNIPVRFSDVFGIDEIKDEIQVYVEYLKNPEKFDDLGAKLPKGVLLTGDPGTGKTLIARAIAGEAGVPFFYTTGSSFDEVFVGVGSRRVRDLLEEAKKVAPCIVFIDEIDSLGAARGGVGTGKDGTLNQLLSELDGFDQKSGVVLIGATNLPEKLDKALLRPGRFDRIIHVPKPDIHGRREMINFYLSKVKVSEEIDTEKLAKTTMGMTGAEISNIVNSAAISAARLGVKGVTTSLIEAAFDDILMGFERKTALITEEGRKKTAFHEAGHALCTYFLTGAKSIRKITIVPRGRSLGLVARLPLSDDSRYTKHEIISSIIIALGGRVGEEVMTGYDNVTTGASSDFQSATNYARVMGLQFGMMEILGPVAVTDQKHLSPERKNILDAEILRTLKECYQKAEEIVHTHKEEHFLLVEALVRYETLSGDDLTTLFNLKQENPSLSDSQIVDLLFKNK